MFIIKYFAPYGGGWRTQSFATLDEAERMIVECRHLSPDCYSFVGRSCLYIAPLFVRIRRPYRLFVRDLQGLWIGGPGALSPWVPSNL